MFKLTDDKATLDEGYERLDNELRQARKLTNAEFKLMLHKLFKEIQETMVDLDNVTMKFFDVFCQKYAHNKAYEYEPLKKEIEDAFDTSKQKQRF
jgi:C4-type Zn-finger protein